ncbi:DUF5658 family protein [Niallia taxi]|uniref:DUF5658 family protein n=1 Tax=Niallia taxi TaxID=2499688 RepID=UPI00203B4E99|nr:DUF5658 family protein [Niallia taxi]MCM3214294.1 DUF5658 family protein [Niallia taxi]MDK8641073.1 DUF5658 family protein [Niallia taxi]MED4052668.1 DUF5658 family protein [Niallia taxi]MED4120023.1 DUF5658 family protein [Niallia taxi]
MFPIKILFWTIGILNLADGILTYIGMQLQLIGEANPLMSSIWELSPYLFLCCKIALSIFLFILAANFKTKHVKTWRMILAIPLLLYVSIFAVHLTWITYAL